VDPGITILEITPSFLSVHLEKIITRTFKISVPYTGTPAQGYIVLEPSAEPASVTLSGARSQIEAIQVLKTKPVDLTGAQETFKKEVPLDLENPRQYSTSDPIIVATVQIQEEQVEKTVENLPVQIRNCPFTAVIEPPAVTIVVKGPFAAMGNKNILGGIFAFIDLEGLSPGVYARNALINIPVGLVMTQADPRVFTVTIE
jgi:YbbR domain-containing protein